MRVLITGICGFVGATLARGLREGSPDWEIIGLDNFVRAGSELNRAALRKLGSSRQLIEHNLVGTINVLELAKGWRSGLILQKKHPNWLEVNVDA